MKELILATRNRGKVRELEKLLEGVVERILFLEDFPGYVEPEETETTFRENALIKAEGAAALGLPALADDSGIEVDALGGAPGVRSARYSGTRDDALNNEKLLRDMAEVSDENRTCRFRCAIAFCTPQGERRVFEGAVEGILLREPKGTGGFGYDPLFLVPEERLTMSEIPMEEKNRISHRSRALAQFVEWLRENGG